MASIVQKENEAAPPPHEEEPAPPPHEEVVKQEEQGQNNIQNKRTIDNHRWFVSQIEKTINKKIKEKEKKKEYMNEMLLILLITFTIISYIMRSDYIILLHRSLLLYTYLLFIYNHDYKLDNLTSLKEIKENTIFNMRFTRLGIFYKNTHYIFLGTKKELEKVFDKMRLEIEEEKKENYFGR